jgi:phosphoglycolate phosphatase/AHBA synthesis associated protein
MPLRAVLFDMDGVLVRTEAVWRRLVGESGRRFRGREITPAEFAPTFGQGTVADIAVFGLSCTPAQLDAFYRDNFARHAAETWVDPEAAPVLADLRARALKTALVTNTAHALAREILAASGLLGALDVLACSDLVPRPKPAPDLVRFALEALGVPAEDALLVGDSRYDREAAAAAGVRFVGFGLDGDSRVDSLRELARITLET